MTYRSTCSPKDGCLHVYGIGEDGVTAFTQYGIECLQQIIATNAKPDTLRRRSPQPNRAACGAHRMLTVQPQGRTKSDKQVGEVQSLVFEKPKIWEQISVAGDELRYCSCPLARLG
jgi:hypothetical protein